MKISPEAQVKLNKFKPRDYQIPIFDALENKGYKKLMIVMPRRAGKDLTCFTLMVRAALRRVGTYYYILPNAVQARRVMFDGMTIDGDRILSYIPKELIHNINIQQMKVTLGNNSIIMFVGSENYDSLRGTNAIGCILSEAAFQHPQCYPTIRPILMANDGWVAFVSTPFGDNHFHTLYKIACESPDWFVYYLTVNDTQHISEEAIQAEIDSGEISYDMAQQEYYCSFSTGATGAYYARYLNSMENEHRVGDIEWEPNFPVHSAWDIGMEDYTSILFFQVIGNSVRIIDMYQNKDVGLEHYINVLQAKDYTWGIHLGPHDLKVREFTSGGLTRFEKAARLGIKFRVVPKLTIIDGIECVRTTLPRMYINQSRCRELLAALRNYRKEYDKERKVYKNRPLHDHNSHVADALRYLCIGLPSVRKGTTPEELDRRYQEARYGDQSSLPRFFRDPV